MLLPVSFVTFDLLLINGEQLLDIPLLERRQRLERFVSGFEQPGLQFTRPQMCHSIEEIESLYPPPWLAATKGSWPKRRSLHTFPGGGDNFGSS
jgi:hypothetical protein